MKKAQTALEYLMTYGWAILIVIIVGAALYSLGVFSPGSWTGKRTTGFALFQMVDFQFKTDANLTMVIGNRLGKTVTLNQIVVNYKQANCTKTIDAPVGPNIQKTYSIYTSAPSTTCSVGWPTSLDLKSSYNIVVDFYYTDTDSGLTHIDSGNLLGAVET
jgi:hypothetical protein